MTGFGLGFFVLLFFSTVRLTKLRNVPVSSQYRDVVWISDLNWHRISSNLNPIFPLNTGSFEM